MRQGLREKCRRVIAGVLTFVMVSMLALGDAGVALASEYGERFYQDGSSVVDEDEYSDTVSTKASFKNHKENGVTISVSASDDSDFRAGGEVYLDVHVKNESSGVIEDGILNFQGRKLKDSGAYFEEEPEDAITEGIMANEREEEEEEPGAEEEELINDLAPEVSEEAPVHMESSEAEGQQSTEGAESESAAEAEAGSEIGMESEATAGTGIGTESEAEAGSEIGKDPEAAAEGETGTEWRAEAESGEEAATEGGSKIENEIAAEGEAETEAEARDDGDPVIKSGDAMQAVAGTAEAGAGEDKTEAATEAIPEEMSVAQENLVMQEDSSAGENEAANGPAAQESAAVESAAASPEEAGPGLQARSAVEETKGTIPAEMPAPEESRGSEDEDWFENEDGERRNEIVAGDTQKRRKSREDDEEEDDGPLQELTDIRLEPGQIYSARFVYTIDESLENAKNQKVVFRFSGKDEKNQNISQHEMFYYTANYLNAGEVRFKDGNRVRTGDEVVMGIHTSVYDFDILLGDDEVLAELASRSDAEKASPSNAQKADASNAEKASPSDAQEATPSNIEEDDIYTDQDEAEEDNEEDEEEEENDDFTVDLGNTSYKIEMINARLNGFKARKALVEDVNDNMLICTYRVSKEVKPGIYFGKIIQESKVKGKTFKSSQGFALIVTGSGEVELKGGIDGAEVQVKGPVESFPDGDVLSLKVSEVPVEKKALVEAALEQKAQETGISVNKLRALDIKVISDGEERELQGDVSVTFSNVELQPLEEFVETAEAAAIAEEEQGVAETVAEEEEGGFSLFGMRRMSRMRAAAPEARTEGDEPADAASAEGELSNELSEAAGSQENDGETESEIAVWHLDENAGVLNDMGGSMDANGDVVMTTNHFSIYIVVDTEKLDGKITLNVQHWANITYPEEQSGVATGTEGLVIEGANGATGPTGIAGDQTATVRTTTAFTEIYEKDEFTLDNQFKRNIEELSKICIANSKRTVKNYTLSEIWILKDGKASTSINRADWTIKKPTDEYTVTLKKNNTIRLVYTPVSTSDALKQDVTFFDYNITDGKRYDANGNVASKGLYVKTQGLGINEESNYTGGSQSNRLAVMPNNGLTHKYREAKGGNEGYAINRSGNGALTGFEIVTGMVTGVNSGGPIYKKIYDPGLFNSTPKTGKKVLDGYKLWFNQVGDTYTLSKVYKGNSKKLDSLETFSETYDARGTHIFSNSFWPLDDVSYKDIPRDPLFGGSTIYSTWNKENVEKSLNQSDEKAAHNWFFGMRYDFKFTLGDYTGPLKYYFRGDDDLWVFIDGELVVDIGGIHKSVGKNVDLSYLKNEQNAKTKEHTLTVIYAERGGYGSSCYMQFTLPNIKPVDIDTTVEKTNVSVRKVWNDFQNPYRPVSIDVQLKYRKGVSGSWINYGNPVTLTAPNSGSKDIWSYTWTGLPKTGYQYKVEELTINGDTSAYRVEYSNDGILQQQTDGSYSGTITNTLSPQVKIQVEKKWDDKENQDGNRPDSVRMQLQYRPKANENETYLAFPGEMGRLELDGKKDSAVSGSREYDSWKGVFEGLPAYIDGVEVVYRVRELNGNVVLGENSTLPGKNPGSEWNYTLTKYEDETWERDNNENLVAKTTVTNKYTPKVIEKSVQKKWEGVPTGITAEAKIGLYKNSDSGWKLVTEESENPVILKWPDGLTTKVWSNLPEYAKGEKIDYRIFEVDANNAPITEQNSKIELNGYQYEVIFTELGTVTTITNKLMKARLRVGKWIDNDTVPPDVLEDEFIITVKGQDSEFETGVMLNPAGHGEGTLSEEKLSGYIEVPAKVGGSSYVIGEKTELKEYTKSTPFVTKYSVTGTLTGEVITVMPEEDDVVLVHNIFHHQDYFHSDDSVENKFDGSGNKPPHENGKSSSQRASLDAVVPQQMADGKSEQLDEDVRLM